ncbi:NADH:flavin oxidoreductase [Gordonia amarae]|uniref:NADH:flavin oxidoreductase n=2 Tax=Gordonia amarae TaxID=36821 RepID=A0A857LH26_9ACTN|nr:NADH:flavin oxidoreductase [Gordonia amarae]MCS3876777.1 2,4-dienoyl-CoA reductase-like NADH-dependent reductase (Old Yellow Enzyme family) [Gordonia amarae]QHN15623.1 NADH:flavin oxidoreductase [Gordonia amarae]QHN20192.1 NADH:flavin oxidoreductase [Gordonia amarae]QHN29043.1 NADH:flavin oxidoreductase [Gordonia amarae]QHN37824.1 NADH:flavin oxidoreductase [Gordonia amarae]
MHSPAAPADPFASATLGPLTLRNRLIKCATFEGMTPDALVTDELIDFHRTHAAGGVAISTVAYCAISPEGRTDRHQIWMRPEAVPGLRRLTDAIHAEGALAAAQLGHAGAVANSVSNRAKALGPSRIPAPMGMSLTHKVGIDEIPLLRAKCADAAKIAVDSGFDALEIHCGHNYLISSFLSPLLNRRRDAYGGSLVNRARLAREVLETVREAVGPDVAVWAKLNMFDGVGTPGPGRSSTLGGFNIDEACQVARWMESDGFIDAIEPTAGSSLLNPMYLFHGQAPRKAFAQAFHGVMKLGLQAGGPLFLKQYQYTDAYLLPLARELRKAVDLPLILLGGITGVDSMTLALAEGFQFMAMGRALLREPDLPLILQNDPTAHSQCTHCNLCMPTIYSTTRCPIRTGEVTGSGW